MATLVLQAAGAVVGGFVAGPVGTAVGRVLGGVAGAAIDDLLFGGDAPVEGARLTEMSGLASTEGAPIPRVYGRARVGGQLIWATRFEEEVVEGDRSTLGGKGSSSSSSTTNYAYFANLAIGLCEGEIAFVRRVWADGQELDLTTVAMRVHRGGEGQEPDPLIVAKEGAENAPAYRGLAYVVFERLPLAEFGNRVPQFAFEVVRPVGGLPEMIRAVCLIPGANEFAYDPLLVAQDLDLGVTRPENRHQLHHATDIAASLDALRALCPNLRRVALVVSWFGNDLRAGACRIEPRVDVPQKVTEGDEWSVAGLVRPTAKPVSLVDGRPAYGGSPSDAGVVRLIQELKSRGLEVVLYPFVMMDIPADNARPNPHSGVSPQPPYPWRGRITCNPGPSRPDTVDGTAAAGAQVASFFGSATPDRFAVVDGEVMFGGPPEWSFRRLVLHYAHLALAAGGVDAFVLGSELVGLTRVRSAPGTYPAVEALTALAADVRSVLGPEPKLVYAADWTEYGAHVPEGGAEVRFPLDPLFAHPAIDAVGIDYYPPISDWRDGTAHLDQAEARSAHDRDYLRRRQASGEAFDWYYPGEAERLAQTRVPITDGAYGKPWVFRAKDLVGWWSNPHVERVGGVETGATAWVPGGKPIWLTEIGIPAVDKGSNGPNVFPDPKSSESAYPPLSRGLRDDLAQIRGLEAILSRFDPALPGFEAAYNPTAGVPGGRMVDPANVFVWSWDARPFPVFADFDTVWADGANWQTGHWITGRIEGAPLDRLVARILRDLGEPEPADLPIDGFVDGYVLDRPLSGRQALEPLARAFGLDAVATPAGIAWQGRGRRTARAVTAADLVATDGQPLLRLTRAQEGDLPVEIELGFIDGEIEYRRGAVSSRRLAAGSRRESRAELAIVTRRAEAQRLAETWLQDLWAGRETAEFELSPRALDVEPGDLLSLPTGAGPRLHRVVRIADGPRRRVTTRGAEPALHVDAGAAPPSAPARRPPSIGGRPSVTVLDFPVQRTGTEVLQWLAVAADPWPGRVAVYRSADGASFRLHRVLAVPAIIGRTVTTLGPGPLWRWDDRTILDCDLSGPVSSIGDLAALAGGNLFAIEGPGGRWELLSAAHAELIGERRYRLSRFLRGLGASEPEVQRVVPPGARLVRLDDSVVALDDGLADLGVPWRYRIGPADRDHGDPSFVEVLAAASGEALKPYAPVRLGAVRRAEGVLIRFVRRTRRGGDPWEPLDAPLAEESERYELEIRQGGVLRRVLPSISPEILYPAALELADFGAPQSALELAVFQVSASAGRGFPRAATVPVE